MKKSVFKNLFSVFAVVAFLMTACSVDSANSTGGGTVEPQTPEIPLTEETETKTETVPEVLGAWVFSDLSNVAIEGVDAEETISDSSALAASAAVYTSFSAVASKKFSLKSDVEYPSSNKNLTAKIKSLGEDEIPIQYNKFEESQTCSVTDASAGDIQIQNSAFVIDSIEGPFKIKIIYSTNATKKDGRYAYIKINNEKYSDTPASSANPLTTSGKSFEKEYTGTDSVRVTVGAAGSSPCYLRLYDVIITKDRIQTTTIKTTTNSDGSVTKITTVTDEDGNVLSETEETTRASSDENTASDDDDASDSEEYTNGSKIGRRSRLTEIDTSGIKNAIYVSTADEFESALTQVKAGGAIVLSEGTYAFDHQLTIAAGNDGSASSMKYILPASGANVTLDFSSQSYDSSDTSKNERGLQVNANYWHIYGLTVYGSADNGIFVAGKHNIIERCILQANRDTGLQISRRASSVTSFDDWPSDNLILNCTSFDNHDPATDENADGFAAKLTCGNGNVFDGCISYCNSDDGWDLYAKSATGSIGVVTLKNCVAFSNGMLTTGSNFANGDMNGFKLGGSNNACPTAHIITNCMAFLNGKDGFTDNGNGGALKVSRCTSYGNTNSNFNFYRTYAGGLFKKLVSMLGSVTPSQVDKFGGKESECTVASKISESVYVTDKKKGVFNYVEEETEIFNGDKVGNSISDLFSSEISSSSAPVFDSTVDAKCRNADGTVNMSGFLETKAASPYKDMGAHFGKEAYEIIDITL